MESTRLKFPGYKSDDIGSFAATLMVEGGFSTLQKQAISENFAELVTDMPWWQQVLLVELNYSNVACDPETLNVISHQHQVSRKSVLGFYLIGSAETPLGLTHTFNTKSGIFWTFDKNGEHDEPTFHHEQGHRLMDIIGTLANEKLVEELFLDPISVWDDAVACEIINSAPVKMKNKPLKFNGSSGLDSLDDGQALYPTYRTLRQHLRGSYRYSQFPDEVFAELNAHYCMLYRLTGGDETYIDRVLTDVAPFTWPVFRDRVIPIGSAIAEKIYRDRCEELLRLPDFIRKGKDGLIDRAPAAP